MQKRSNKSYINIGQAFLESVNFSNFSFLRTFTCFKADGVILSVWVVQFPFDDSVTPKSLCLTTVSTVSQLN
jgi:hypothetical protein